ncbi:MAG: M23 family metallopeptidase [Acidimicrobiales bacterium]|nr:M23 family metallopeptidase [Acidimicrobiales bacterium]
MPVVPRLLRRVWIPVIAVLGIIVVEAPTAAAEARPVPRSPFTCGQVWFARTYAGHPRFAIDWNLPGSGEADFGQPVLAGGAGIAAVENHSGYGNMVTIDHGDGWKTLYAHLSSISVVTGQPVGMDTVVGRVGNTGRSDGSHLHQEQLFNGVRQPVMVDGVVINPSYSSRESSYASGNCPAPTPEPVRIRLAAWGRCKSAAVVGWAFRCATP